MDSEIDDTNDNDFMKVLRKPLFGGVSQDVSPTDVISWGITVNIKPTIFINKKQWKLYDHDKQKAILTRIEAKLRKDNPSIVLKKLMFEVCPKIKNIHFHALYEMPSIFESTIETYYHRVCNKGDTTGWRVIDTQPIYDEEGWIKYISKDLKT